MALEKSLIKTYGLENKLVSIPKQNICEAYLDDIENKLGYLDNKRKNIIELEKNFFNNVYNLLLQTKTLVNSELNLKRDAPRSGLINLDFLEMSKINKYKLQRERYFELNLPLFSVYNVKDFKGFSNIEINMVNVANRADADVYAQINHYPKLNKIITHKLLSCISEEECIKIYKYLFYLNSSMRFNFTSQFYGFIPNDVREVIKKAKDYFDEVYIVTEAEHKIELTTPNPTGDPLVIGILNKKAFLLDEFNCTPLENYAKNFFLENKPGAN